MDAQVLTDAIMEREDLNVKAYVKALGVEEKKATRLIVLGMQLAARQWAIATSLGCLETLKQK